MHCDDIREGFSRCQEPPDHLLDCTECREEWEVHVALRTLKAPSLGADFEARVLTQLEARGLFEPATPTILEKFSSWLSQLVTPAAVLACLLLLLWLGDLANTRPAPELRALRPDRARLWTSLPDAVPPPVFPGPAPSRVRRPLVKADQP